MHLKPRHNLKQHRIAKTSSTRRNHCKFFHQKSNFRLQTDIAKEPEEIMREIRPRQMTHHDYSKPFVLKGLRQVAETGNSRFPTQRHRPRIPSTALRWKE